MIDINSKLTHQSDAKGPHIILIPVLITTPITANGFGRHKVSGAALPTLKRELLRHSKVTDLQIRQVVGHDHQKMLRLKVQMDNLLLLQVVEPLQNGIGHGEHGVGGEVSRLCKELWEFKERILLDYLGCTSELLMRANALLHHQLVSLLVE